MTELEKSYNAAEVEDKIYQTWLDSGCFAPENLPERNQSGKTFSVVLPPPNVTGTLHMGHAFEDTLQDIAIRYHRMKGEKTVWIPGTDHAAISTQAKFEKDLYKKEGKSRHDYSRKEFVKMIDEFALGNQESILSKLNKMGLSLDWSRLAFTLDQKREVAVRTAFQRMYDAGLIYRGFRVVNWDPKGQTTVSDDEVIHEEAKASLYTFKYSKGFPISIATTRPETKVGDTAVAVHPSDKRYQQYVGQTFSVDFAGTPLEIRIIADESVDPEFGTGALGVTPAHSMVDWEMSQKHNLPIKPVINEFAKMSVDNPLLKGKKTLEAREILVQWLKDNNLLEKEEIIDQNISKAERTNGVIEPLPKMQWFIDVNKQFTLLHSRINGIESGQEVTLKQIMKQVVESGQIQILPERFGKVYHHWINNLRDWCISRQILYGHQIPVWYCRNCDEGKIGGAFALKPEFETVHTSPEFIDQHAKALAAIETPLSCPVCGSSELVQDPDTLDTWFSSGLWTFSTLGWPEQTEDLKNFHPTSVIMPGYEILFVWVARMILMSGFLLGDIPFHNVYLHGLVRDSKGRKFSKSLDNGIDPLEVSQEFGTDALRMALIAGVAPGNDTLYDQQKVKGYKHFGNKLWNIARFVLQSIDEARIRNQESGENAPEPMTEADKDILTKMEATIAETTDDLENLRLHEAAQSIYQFTWHEFADVYIEASKAQLQDEKTKENTEAILFHTLLQILKLLHPFMPFITEELWSKLSQKDLLLVTPWPENK
jgi:valyl-tRNA synthetase